MTHELKRITLDDLEPGMLFGYSFIGIEGRRYCVGECQRIAGGKLFVTRAKLVSVLDDPTIEHGWEDYPGGTQSGYNSDVHDAEAWEIYEYDEELLWAAACAERLRSG